MRLLIMLTSILMLPGLAWADQPMLVPVQGLLTDAEGEAIDGEVTLLFEFIDDADETLWRSEVPTVVRNGKFSVNLGAVTALDASFFSENLGLSLMMSIDGETLGAWPVGATPYAAHAAQATNAATLEGQRASDFAAADHTHELVAGQGLTIDEDGNLAVAEGSIGPQHLADAGCENGSVLKWDAGAWGCAADSDSDINEEAVEGIARRVAFDTPAELHEALDPRYFQAPQDCVHG